MTHSDSKQVSDFTDSPRRSARLAESLLRHLDGYRLAASAAGVAMLACSSPAEAAPICGTLSITLLRTDTYAFNPAHQQTPPFNVAQTYNELSSHTMSQIGRAFFTPNMAGAKELIGANGFPSDVASGASIGPGGQFGKGKSYGLMFVYQYLNRYGGNFKPGQNGYVGFQFSISGQTHYGWLRLQPNGKARTTVLDAYGYESTPNKGILAGSCTSSASSIGGVPHGQSASAGLIAESQDVQPAKSVSRPVAPAPGSLGLLALGSAGIQHWRSSKSE